MKDKDCCKTCAHFIEMEPDHSRLFSDRYGCDLHRLYNGEVSDPHWQICPEHQSNISKLRNDKLELHPDALRGLSERLDGLEARIFANPRVDFAIVEECSNYGGAHFGKDCSCKEDFLQYAKIIEFGYESNS